MKTFLMLIGIVILLVFGIVVFKPKPEDIQTVADLEAYLDKMVEGGNPPGLSLAVVKQGEFVYQYATGLADGPNSVPASTDTVYHWWSATKVVTAIGVLQLAEQGLVDLDSSVTDYLPYFKVDYADYSGPVTVRQLLRHTSGLPDTVPAIVGWVHTENVVYDQVEQVRQYMPDYNSLKFEPDTKSAYTNYGYMVLGALISEVTGQSYEEYVIHHILEPAQMTQTGFLYPDGIGANEAAGSHPVLNYMTPLLPFYLDFDAIVRERTGLTLWFNRIYLDVTPSSGLIGPVDDFAKLVIALQKPDLLLSEESYLSMLPVGEEPTERPLGWAEFGLDGSLWVQHSGGGPGFATIMRLYPDESIAIFIMANGTNLDREGLAEAVAKIPWD